MKELVKSDLDNVAGGFFFGNPVAKQQMIQERIEWKNEKKKVKIKTLQDKRQYIQDKKEYYRSLYQS